VERVELIRSIESAAYQSWPARETVEYDGWQLRFADGFSRRGNSVYPAESSRLGWIEKLTWCQNWFADRELDLVVRQTPASEFGLDEFLESEGFVAEGHTHVMVADLIEGEASVEVAAVASDEWLEATSKLWRIEPDRIPGWEATINRIELPVGYGLVGGNSEPVAAGFGVVADGWLGLFEIIVSGTARRSGVGGRLTASLMEWGRQRGAVRSYLQVTSGNAPAIALYESLEFVPVHDYWYRRAPSR